MNKISSVVAVILFAMFLFIEGTKGILISDISIENVSISNEYLQSIQRICITKEAFGKSSINISKFRNNAIIETEYGILSAYYNEDGKAEIVLLDLESAKSRKLVLSQKVEDSILADGHCSINIGYDDATVYFAYGAHCTKCYYGSFPIDDFYNKNEEINIKISDVNMTYPQFYNYAEKIYLVYRNDENNSWCYSEMKPDGEILSGEENMFLYSNENTLYINDIAISPNENYVVAPFVERLPYNPKDNLILNDGIYLLFSKNSINRWESLGNETLEIPIKFSKCKKVIDIGAKENLMNQDSTYVTDNGKVFFTRLNDDDRGIPQIYLTVYDLENGEIASIQISDNEKDFDLKGTGSLVLPLSRAQVLVSESFVHVIWRQDKNIMISSAIIDLEENSFGTFKNMVVDDIEVEAWEPNVDINLWKKSKEIILFVQSTKQGEADKAVDEENENSKLVYLYFFKEND